MCHNPKIVQKTSRNKILIKYFRKVSDSFREVSAYFREVSAYFREVSAYCREVSAYVLLEQSFQNFETSFEKFGASGNRGFAMILRLTVIINTKSSPISDPQ